MHHILKENDINKVHPSEIRNEIQDLQIRNYNTFYPGDHRHLRAEPTARHLIESLCILVASASAT